MSRLFKNVFLFLIIILSACQTPQTLISTISNPKQPLSEDDNIATLYPYDAANISPDFIVGKISTPFKGKPIDGDIVTILKSFDSIAQRNGANLIRIEHIHYSNALADPDRAIAVLYRVPDIRTYEKRIHWKANRKLTWEDFKGKIPDTLVKNTNYSSFANIGIQHRSNASFLVGSNRFFVISTFDCTKSWYRPYVYYNSHYLDFQQGLFDLTEMFARKMQQQLSTKKVKDKLAFMQKIDKDLTQQYRDAETQYVLETRGGSDTSALQKWHQKIWKELGM